MGPSCGRMQHHLAEGSVFPKGRGWAATGREAGECVVGLDGGIGGEKERREAERKGEKEEGTKGRGRKEKREERRKR